MVAPDTGVATVPAGGPGDTLGALDETRLGLVRAVAVGTPAYLAFMPLDLYVRASLFPETSVEYCVAARVGGALSLVLAWLLLRRPGWSPRGLLVLTSCVLSLGLISLALLAVGLGGLASSYIFTPAFYAVGVGTFLPSHWRQSVGVIVPSLGAFAATLMLGVALTPELAWQYDDAHTIAVFVENGVLIIGIVGFAALSGHVLWSARTRLRDARRLGRYLLRAPLGQGGMNEVWLAWDATLRREVALKLLRARHRLAVGDALRVRFEREALATSKLHSPHTVKIFDFGADSEGTAWIAMEYLRGKDLDALVATWGPLDPRRVVHFARQAALSLAEAHANGIVHRDIKPANLVALSAEGQRDFVKVLDFGIARQLDSEEASLTLVGMVIGTPAFMPPEVLAGQPADPKSDVWSFGATLYTLLTGALPYDPGGQPYAGLARGPLPPPSERLGRPLPPGLDALVMRCMASDPAQRPADGEALVLAIDAVVALGIGSWTEADAQAWWAERMAAPTAPQHAATGDRTLVDQVDETALAAMR